MSVYRSVDVSSKIFAGQICMEKLHVIHVLKKKVGPAENQLRYS